MSTIEAKSKPDFLEYYSTLGITTMEGRGFYVPHDTAIGKDGRLYVVNRSQQNVTRGVRITVCDLEGEFFGCFGSYGEGNGQFVSASGGAIDSQGRLYISDEHNHRITVFDHSGQYLSKWGTHGAGEGELDTPSGIAFSSQDNLYVADTYNNRIQKFTAEGRFLLSFGSQIDGDGGLRLPWGVAVDTQEDVYVADWGNDRIQKFSPKGEHLATYGTSGNGEGEFYRPSGVAVDHDGYIYVADWGNERVQVLDREGRFVTKLRGQATLSKWAENFFSVNVEEGGARSRANLELDIDYFVNEPHEESSHIEKYFWAPVSVKLDGAGRLYVTEANRHRIQVYQRTA
ncbi:MAG: NHL repeat-containing protein [Dehalococcoidia bacterium]